MAMTDGCHGDQQAEVMELVLGGKSITGPSCKRTMANETSGQFFSRLVSKTFLQILQHCEGAI